MLLCDIGETVVSGNRIEWTLQNVASIQLENVCVRSKNFSFKGERFRFVSFPKERTPRASKGWLGVCLECLSRKDLSMYSAHFSIRKRSGDETESSTVYYNNFSSIFSNRQFIQWNTFLQNKDDLVPNGQLTIICCIFKIGVEPAEVESRLGRTTLVSSNQLKSDAAVQTIEDEDVRCIISESKDAVALRGEFEAMYQTGAFCDFDVKVQDRVFRTHKMVLAARSSAFASMLQHDMKEKNTGMVEIVDCDSDTFEAFLKFLYGGKNEVIIPENVASLYEVANKYDVQNLKAECHRFMMENLSTELFCDVMCLALRHDERELIRRATEYFKLNKKNIFLSVKWQIFLEENPTYANELLIKICD